jgi:acyl carrier protein
MTRDQVRDWMNTILGKQGKPAIDDDAADLRSIGFRSLDFSELALRVEMTTGNELNFDAAALRGIETVDDVLTFFTEATGAG